MDSSKVVVLILVQIFMQSSDLSLLLLNTVSGLKCPPCCWSNVYCLCSPMTFGKIQGVGLREKYIKANHKIELGGIENTLQFSDSISNTYCKDPSS